MVQHYNVAYNGRVVNVNLSENVMHILSNIHMNRTGLICIKPQQQLSFVLMTL